MAKVLRIDESERWSDWSEPCRTPIAPYQPQKRMDWLSLGLAILVLCAFVAILSVMWEWNV